MQVLAELKADDLPYVPPFNGMGDALPTSSVTPTGMNKICSLCALPYMFLLNDFVSKYIFHIDQLVNFSYFVASLLVLLTIYVLCVQLLLMEIIVIYIVFHSRLFTCIHYALQYLRIVET